MIAGIVLFAFAMKETLAHVGDELDTVAAVCLCGGSALNLFAYVALRVRVAGTLGGGRLVAALVCTLLIPVALLGPAVAALALVAAVWVGLHAYELIWWREERAQARASCAGLTAVTLRHGGGRSSAPRMRGESVRRARAQVPRALRPGLPLGSTFLTWRSPDR